MATECCVLDKMVRTTYTVGFCTTIPYDSVAWQSYYVYSLKINHSKAELVSEKFYSND